MKDKIFEIERKFLVKNIPNLQGYERFKIKQGYISIDPVLRIRQKNDKFLFTFKGNGDIKRVEFENEITREQFENLWKKVEGNPIIKTRYIIPLENCLKAELDIYEDKFLGFCNVEVEFKSIEEAEKFTPPDWFGQDITKDKIFTNSYLSNIGNFTKKYN